MKRARSEQIQSLVLSYLKKRNFTDSETSFKSDCKFEENIKEMATRLSEETDASTSNCVVLSALSIDEYFTAFEEFLTFCTEAGTDHPKLLDLPYPIFCHMYLDLVMAGRKADAGTFFQHFEVMIQSRSEVESLSIEKLGQVIQATDIESFEEVRMFRRKKYEVDLGLDSHSLLLRFLHSSSSHAILKVINLHLFLKVTEGKTLFDLFSTSSSVKPFRLASESEKVSKKKRQSIDGHQRKPNGISAPKHEPVTLSAPSLLSPPTPVSVPSEQSQPVIPEVDLKMLRASVQKVGESKPCIENIRVHRFHDTGLVGLTNSTISNNYGLLCTSHEDSSARIWELLPGTLKKPFQTSDENDALTHDNCIAGNRTSKFKQLSADVSKVHFGCDFFDTVKAKLESSSPSHGKALRAHSDSVSCSCFSHDDKFLLTSSEDTTVRLWDLASCKNKAVYRGHVHPVWCVAMSNYSLYFATGSFDKTARLWTTERTYPLRTFAGHHSDVECLAFHSNSTYLATADKVIRLWDIASGKAVRILIGHWAAVSCLAFSPNGKFLASSGEDGKIRMWDIASGALIKELRGHEGSVYSLDFSPDGSMLASGGSDSRLRVWNTRTSQTPTTKVNTDTNDAKLNPDFIGRWQVSEGAIHSVKFESCNLLHCAVADG